MATNPFTRERIATLTRRVHANTKEQIISLTRELTEENQRLIGGVLGGGSVPFVRYVDGALNKPLNDVNPNGFTLTEFELLGRVVDAALEMLAIRSPFGPEEGGHYRDDHWLYVNGQRRDAFQEGAEVMIKPTDDVVIVNTRAYARKIEGGARNRFRRRLIDRRPGLSVQAPDGVYEVSARDLYARFGNIARIRFAYHDTAGGSSGRYPALEITGRV